MMGITSPLFPLENTSSGHDVSAYDPTPDPEDDGTALDHFTSFMSLLAPPPRAPQTPQSILGATVFVSADCAGCHTPALVTGANAVPQLSNQAFAPFSDFLLHDMGSLGDGITQGGATGRLMRTAPLWGVTAQPLLLHDGRATTLDAAIRAHAGQGATARDKFATLSSQRRAALLAFLATL